MTRRLAVAWFVFAAMVGAAPTTAGAKQGSVTAQVLLPKHKLAAGSTMDATVVVRNTTGAPVQVIGCGSIFQVALSNRDVTPLVGWRACAQTITIPEGISRFPVEVSARFTSCGEGGPGPACLPGFEVPPLPPGTYRAKLYQQPSVAPTPRSIVVVVTP